MENEPKREEDLAQGLREIINISPEAIQRELTGGSGNPWLACLNSRVSAIRGRLARIEMAGIMSEEELQAIKQRVDNLVAKEKEVIKNHGWNPPEEIKREFLEELSNIYK